MNLLASRDNVFADFDNAQLKYFNQTLQRQVAELEQELFFTSPEGNGNQYGHLFSLNRTQMLRNIELRTAQARAVPNRFCKSRVWTDIVSCIWRRAAARSASSF